MLPFIVGTLLVGVIGVIMQQFLLRWNQGQDLRQALITIAVSIIFADQMLDHFGGIAEGITWPGRIDHFVEPARRTSVQYSEERLLILAARAGDRRGALAVAAEDAHGHGDPRGRRRPRDGERPRHQHPANVCGGVLRRLGARGLGGVVGGSFASLAPGVDSNWLLNSLVVVIIGGMGSLGGAAIGSLLLGLTTNLSAAYLPQTYNYYSIVLTFVLLALVLAVRPLGIYGRPA